MAETVTIPEIEIFQTGTFNGDTYTKDDLQSILDAAPEVGFQVPVKLGHMGDADTKALLKKEGLPAFGYVSNLRIKGKKVLADLIDVPKRLGEIIKKKGYTRVSAEIYWNFRKGSKTFPRVLKAVALLGAEIPAITDLASVEALYDQMKRLDAEGHEYRVYFDTGIALKRKEAVNYRETTGATERCGTCRFYLGLREAGSVGFCSLVEGGIATEFVCDLFEMADAFIDTGELETETAVEAVKRAQAKREDEDEKKKKGKTKDKDDSPNRQYTIEKRGDEYCLISDEGEVLGCHPTEAEARAQEEAIQSQMDKDVIRFSVEEVRLACPECADDMVTANIKELKIAIEPEMQYRNIDYASHIDKLVAWVGKVGYDACLTKLKSKKVCGFLRDKADAHKASLEAGTHGQQAQGDGTMSDKGNATPQISPAEVAELKVLLDRQAEELKTHRGEVTVRDERIAVLERQNREAEVKKECDRLKSAGILKPAQEAVFRNLLMHFKGGEKIVEYADGKKGDIVQDFITWVETFPKPSVLTELSLGHLQRDEGDVTGMSQAEAGQELVKKAREYSALHPTVEFSNCMKHARELNPDLAKRYAGIAS